MPVVQQNVWKIIKRNDCAVFNALLYVYISIKCLSMSCPPREKASSRHRSNECEYNLHGYMLMTHRIWSARVAWYRESDLFMAWCSKQFTYERYTMYSCTLPLHKQDTCPTIRWQNDEMTLLVLQSMDLTMWLILSAMTFWHCILLVRQTR